mgnify:CR=1 FL=1
MSTTQYVIDTASINMLRNCITQVNSNVEQVQNSVNQTNNNVIYVNNELAKLKQEFDAYVKQQVLQNRLQLAETRSVKLKQELTNKYGHYEQVRRTTTGILQADDLGIVRSETIQTATEELMISTPRYWLAPCLVALSAWIINNPELADKALKEGIKRNDEKTSLLFALICRRANRKPSSLKWFKRYLDNQDEEHLSRKTIVVLDAFVSGLLGVDSENIIFDKINTWLQRLNAKPGFAEAQARQWFDAIKLRRQPCNPADYPYLSKFSHTWPQMDSVLQGAYLHGTILNYFTGIFEQKINTAGLKEQLDDILTSLVTDFDTEETPIREELRKEELVVKYRGDEIQASKIMQGEKAAFAETKNFTKLLTDAAMKPDIAHASVSTQKFAIALSKDWITAAYKDVIAENRSQVPVQIEVNVDTFNGVTKNGDNEQQLVTDFNTLVNQEENAQLATCVLKPFDHFCFGGGIVIAAMGLFSLVSGSVFMGILIGLVGVGMVLHYQGTKKSIAERRENITKAFQKKRQKGTQIIRALLAEVVDFRQKFAEKDQESQQVLDFLERITPDQYVHKLTDTGRKVKLNK